MNETAELNPTATSVGERGPDTELAAVSNFDPIAIGDEIAALEVEAQSKLADARDEFITRSEKIAAILWEVKMHHPEHLKAICEQAKIGRSRLKSCSRSVAAARQLRNLVKSLLSARAEAGQTERRRPERRRP